MSSAGHVLSRRVAHPGPNPPGYPTILLRIRCASLARRYERPFSGFLLPRVKKWAGLYTGARAIVL